MVELIRKQYRTARKAHRCWHCENEILPGERYRVETLTDGQVYSLKTHTICAAIDSAFSDLVGYDQRDYYDDGVPSLYEVVSEYRKELEQHNPAAMVVYGLLKTAEGRAALNAMRPPKA